MTPYTSPSTEDPLTYLPRKPARQFSKREVIYGAEQPCAHLYLVIAGRVKITSVRPGDIRSAARLLGPDELFGEPSLLGGVAGQTRTAEALEDVAVMCWSAGEIEKQIHREPRLGLALMQHLVTQCLELQTRIEALTCYRTPERVMLALVQLTRTMGTPLNNGTSRMAALTHQTLAEYIGTSREIVSFELNRLRRLGLIRYSRQHMDVYVDAIGATMRDSHAPERCGVKRHMTAG